MILKVQMGYECTKILSEAMIGARCSNHLILRCTAFLGEGSRKNSLKKIIEDENPTITLTPDSEFNYVLYKDVLKFINTATEKDLQGIYNIASSENIELSKVAEMCKKQVQFGSYTYKVGKIDNTKAISVNPEFKKTSKQVIQKYITIWQKKGTF
jgi:dTDP-4-dehydrorhamnose reductase